MFRAGWIFSRSYVKNEIFGFRLWDFRVDVDFKQTSNRRQLLYTSYSKNVSRRIHFFAMSKKELKGNSFFVLNCFANWCRKWTKFRDIWVFRVDVDFKQSSNRRQLLYKSLESTLNTICTPVIQRMFRARITFFAMSKKNEIFGFRLWGFRALV